jgi:hypothetical protein
MGIENPHNGHVAWVDPDGWYVVPEPAGPKPGDPVNANTPVGTWVRAHDERYAGQTSERGNEGWYYGERWAHYRDLTVCEPPEGER